MDCCYKYYSRKKEKIIINKEKEIYQELVYLMDIKNLNNGKHSKTIKLYVY